MDAKSTDLRVALADLFFHANVKLASLGLKDERLWRLCKLFGEVSYDIEAARCRAGLVKVVVATSLPWSDDKRPAVRRDHARVGVVFCAALRHGVGPEFGVQLAGPAKDAAWRVQQAAQQAWRVARKLDYCARCGICVGRRPVREALTRREDEDMMLKIQGWLTESGAELRVHYDAQEREFRAALYRGIQLRFVSHDVSLEMAVSNVMHAWESAP